VKLSVHDPVNILVVDNQPANILSYEAILSELGEKPIKAGSAKEALEQMLKTEIAVVLTDVCMPGLDGFDLAAMIREHPRFENTPIIFISAFDLTDSDRLRGFEAGAVDYIKAPVARQLLRAKVKVFADLHRKTRQLERLNAELEQRVAERTVALIESKQHLQFVADHAPVAIAQCDSQRRYKFVNQPYADLFGCRPADIVGRHPREVLGEQAYVHAAPYMEEALAGHRTKYDLELPNTPHGLRAVRVAYTPELEASGRVVGWVAAISDITDRKQAEQRLHEALRLASVACEAGRMGAWHLDVENDRLTYSDELLALMGIDKSQFGGTSEAVEAFTHPDDIERRRKDRANALAQGDRWEYDYRILRPDGEVRWMSSRGKIVRRTEGIPIEAYGMTLDVTERKRAEAHVRFIMKELSHRTKNLMAVVQTISWQTARQSLDLEDFEQRFTHRVEALGRSQDLLVKRDWRGVVLEELVRAQLEPFLDRTEERLATQGPALLLMPAAAQDLGLALHELATNASKYGALSVPSGKIEIGWRIAGAKRFHMTWRESGGPRVSPPVRKGFGSTVITGTLARTFNGEAQLEYRSEGLCWELTAPMDPLIEELDLH
jgi:PAS domain S-box-containing protein